MIQDDPRSSSYSRGLCIVETVVTKLLTPGETCDAGCTSNVGWKACQGSCNTQVDPASGESCFYYLRCSNDCQSCVEPSPQGVDVDLTITSVGWGKNCKPNEFVAGGSCGVEYVKANLGSEAVLGRNDCHTYYTLVCIWLLHPLHLHRQEFWLDPWLTMGWRRGKRHALLAVPQVSHLTSQQASTTYVFVLMTTRIILEVNPDLLWRLMKLIIV